MTDDDLSEFAEFLWLCCAESEEAGDRIVVPPANGSSTYCPLNAAFDGILDGPLSKAEVCGFTRGFDGCARGPGNRKMYELGVRFREHALSGEPW